MLSNLLGSAEPDKWGEPQMPIIDKQRIKQINDDVVHWVRFMMVKFVAENAERLRKLRTQKAGTQKATSNSISR